ncbi:MAG: lipoate--protein ligase [Coriobacteriia bacterium]|nr:lipoate--protein ligase [Coriobacteriia bacterium]
MSRGTTLRFLATDSRDAALNLATEELLVNTDDGRDVIMLWQNDPVVVVGRHQNTELQVDRAYCADHGIAVVRRLSGGGAVYHDHGNLCYTFITRQTTGRQPDFRQFARPVLEALERLGLRAELSGRNDLMLDGRKFSGLAQYRHGTTLMQHGALLFDTDLSVLGRALKPKRRQLDLLPATPGVASHGARVINLREYLSCSFGEFRDTLAACFTAGAEVEARPLGADERSAADALAQTRYRSAAWNWGQSPHYDLRAEALTTAGTVLLCVALDQAGTINAARLYGDYFEHEPVVDLEEALRGLTPAQVVARAPELKASRFISGIDDRDFAALASALEPA